MDTTPAKSSGSNKLLFGLSDTQQMMFAFGDSRRPNIETAKIVEGVILAQVTEIVHEAVKASFLRGFKMVQLESILFLMRSSPLKIQRLIRYLSAKELARRATKVSDGEVEENKKKTFMGRCKDFIESIDDTGTLLAACNEQYFDEKFAMYLWSDTVNYGNCFALLKGWMAKTCLRVETTSIDRIH